MAKNYDAEIKELQARITKKKAEQRKQKKKFEANLGLALTERFPDLLEMNYEDDFNISEYIKTKEFANMIYAAYKKDEKEAAASATAGTYNEQNEQNESYQ